MRKFFKALQWIIVGLFAVVILTLALALVVNWKDQPPSAAALKLRAISDDRAPVADADNGYVYALGFVAGADADPQQVGALVMAWLEAFEFGDDISANPAHRFGSFKNPSYDARKEFRDTCQKANDSDCRTAFDRIVEGGSLTQADRDYLVRYRELLKRSAWREAAVSEYRLPVPAFVNILHGQRLLMVELRLRARAGAAAEIRAELGADHEFWRMVLVSSDQLLTKLIAVTALRQNFYFGNLVMRALPVNEQIDALPAGWTREFSTNEVALDRAMAGEMLLTESLIRDLLDPEKMFSGDDGPLDEPKWGHYLVSDVVGAFYQPQDLVNHTAEYFLAVADLSKITWSKLEDATAALRERQRENSKPSWSLYNPVGQWFRPNLGDYSKYPLRVASLEGMRRAALLTVQLRGRAISSESIEGELKSAELRNPFDGKPYSWSADERAVVFTGVDGAPINPHFYFY